MDGQLQKLADLIKPIEPPKPPTAYFGKLVARFRQWWAILQLRRHYAKRGVHVWKYTDEEFKEELRKGLPYCINHISGHDCILTRLERRALSEREVILYGDAGYRFYKVESGVKYIRLPAIYKFED